MHFPVSFLPGRIVMERGVRGDYFALERFHYLRRRPATFAGVWVARFLPTARGSAPARIAAVAVVSYPTLALRARERVLKLDLLDPAERARFVNRHIRTISRVIVHPQFRGLGLGSALVRRICGQCEVDFIEAVAAMGRIHPLFARAGMEAHGPDGDGPVYYLWRKAPQPAGPGAAASRADVADRAGAIAPP